MNEILIQLIPIVGMLLITYLILHHFFNKKILNHKNQLSIEKNKNFLPLQIQAYERIILFLERIDPTNMIIRTHNKKMNAKALHRELLKIIREEYIHNMSQQIYIQPNSWKSLLDAKEETIQIINVAINKLDENATGLDLSAKIFESISKSKISPTEKARNSIVKEFQISLK